MLNTKLRDITLAINDLRIIIVSLRLNLLGGAFLEHVIHILRLVHAHHIRVDWRSLVSSIIINIRSFISFELVFLSWSYNSLFRVGWAYIILLMSFGASNPVHGLLFLVTDLYHLLCLLEINMRLNHVWVNERLMHCCRLVERYLNSSICISYQYHMVKLVKKQIKCTY